MSHTSCVAGYDVCKLLVTTLHSIVIYKVRTMDDMSDSTCNYPSFYCHIQASTTWLFPVGACNYPSFYCHIQVYSSVFCICISCNYPSFYCHIQANVIANKMVKTCNYPLFYCHIQGVNDK